MERKIECEKGGPLRGIYPIYPMYIAISVSGEMAVAATIDELYVGLPYE